ncbi:hypothetical protein EVA_08808 [gut metagenome]|uniref:Uncharacterized protein n=1 Tax=gut metagenome TaxID=749906 RepID=J9CSC5_9ZZZZ
MGLDFLKSPQFRHSSYCPLWDDPIPACQHLPAFHCRLHRLSHTN